MDASAQASPVKLGADPSSGQRGEDGEDGDEPGRSYYSTITSTCSFDQATNGSGAGFPLQMGEQQQPVPASHNPEPDMKVRVGWMDEGDWMSPRNEQTGIGDHYCSMY